MFIDQLRSITAKLPGVTEEVKWENDLCFCVAGKMFCVAPLTGEARVSFKVTNNEFDELCGREQVIPAPYLARAQWIMATGGSAFSKKEWEQYITQSYYLVAAKLPKKTREALGLP